MIFLLCISALLPNFNTQYITDQLEILYNKLNSSKNYLLSMILLINNDQDNIEIIGLNNLNSTQNKEIMITHFEWEGVPFFGYNAFFISIIIFGKLVFFKNTISFQTTKEKNLTQITPALDRKVRQNLFIRYENKIRQLFVNKAYLIQEFDGSPLAGHSLQIFQLLVIQSIKQIEFYDFNWMAFQIHKIYIIFS